MFKTTQSLERSRDFASWLSALTTIPDLSKVPPLADFMKLLTIERRREGRMGPLILPSFSRNWKMFPTGKHDFQSNFNILKLFLKNNSFF